MIYFFFYFIISNFCFVLFLLCWKIDSEEISICKGKLIYSVSLIHETKEIASVPKLFSLQCLQSFLEGI